MSAVSILPKGSMITRMAIALAVARGKVADAALHADARWGEGSAAARVLKAAQNAGSTIPADTWGATLADYSVGAGEFWSLVQESSLLGRLTGLRRTPLNIKTVVATTGANAWWVGQHSPTPLTRMSFEVDPLFPLKMASMLVISDELARAATDQAEALIRADLVRAIGAGVDAAFLTPGSAGIVNVQPASITYGVTPVTATATPSLDVDALIGAFQGDLSRAYFIASPTHLSSMSSAALPDVGARGGSLKGVPTLASKAAGNNLILIDPGGVALGEDTLAIDASKEASVQIDDAPATGAVQEVSLWQNGLGSVRAIKPINWRRMNAGVVEYISYGS